MIDIKKIKIDIAEEIKEHNLNDYEALALYVIAYHDYLEHMSNHSVVEAEFYKYTLIEFIPEDYISF